MSHRDFKGKGTELLGTRRYLTCHLSTVQAVATRRADAWDGEDLGQGQFCHLTRVSCCSRHVIGGDGWQRRSRGRNWDGPGRVASSVGAIVVRSWRGNQIAS